MISEAPAQYLSSLSCLNYIYLFRVVYHIYCCSAKTPFNPLSLDHRNPQANSDIICEMITSYAENRCVSQPTIFIKNDVRCAATDINNNDSKFLFVVCKCCFC